MADKGRPAPLPVPWLRPSGQARSGEGPPAEAAGRGGSPLDQVAPPVFRLTPQGRLFLDGQTRADIERVALLHGRQEALARLDEATQALGEQARREVRALYERHVQYERALATALVNQPEQPTIDDARRQLQLMQELRAQHFGEQAAALFGAEEALQQRLLDDAQEAMRTGRMTLEEAVGAAQEKLARELASGATPP